MIRISIFERNMYSIKVTTKYEPIFCWFMFGRFYVDKLIFSFHKNSATNDTSVVSYGAERGNEG